MVYDCVDVIKNLEVINIRATEIMRSFPQPFNATYSFTTKLPVEKKTLSYISFFQLKYRISIKT